MRRSASATSSMKDFSSGFLVSVLLIAGVSVFLAVPFTLFQRLDIGYRTKHADELRVTTKQETNPQGQVVAEHYEYRPSPWAIPARVSGLLATVVGNRS